MTEFAIYQLLLQSPEKIYVNKTRTKAYLLSGDAMYVFTGGFKNKTESEIQTIVRDKMKELT